MKTGEKTLFRVTDKSIIAADAVYVEAQELKEHEHNHNKVQAPEGRETFYEIEVTAMSKAKEKWNATDAEAGGVVRVQGQRKRAVQGGEVRGDDRQLQEGGGLGGQGHRGQGVRGRRSAQEEEARVIHLGE